jgi:hypothetical protein
MKRKCAESLSGPRSDSKDRKKGQISEHATEVGGIALPAFSTFF